jgi:hypothetical protein
MAEKHPLIPVWFFVGVMILIYGIAILLTGLSEWSGGLFVLLGAFFCFRFRPSFNDS